jgi:hypothetical protein
MAESARFLVSPQLPGDPGDVVFDFRQEANALIEPRWDGRFVLILGDLATAKTIETH